MSLIIAMGVAGHFSSGFLGRYPVADRQLASVEMRTAGDYVQRRFHAAAGRVFSQEEPRRKVLLIGDSFAQDLLNAVVEGGFEAHFAFSTHHVTHGCASLAIQRAECLASGQVIGVPDHSTVPLLADAALVSRLRQADEIWLAAAWQDWQIAHILAAVRSFRDLHPRPVRVFGRKDFGKVSIGALLAMSREQRLALMTEVDPVTPAINAGLRNRLAGEHDAAFIDLQTLGCGDNPKLCPLFTPAGDLKSHDGGHLTKEGATFFGKQLAASDDFRLILQATATPQNNPKH